MSPTHRLLAIPLLIAAMVGCGDLDKGPFVIDAPVDTVVVRLSNGDLTVRAHERDEVVIEADFGGLARPGAVGRYVEDGVLTVDYDCVLCGGDITVSVPAWVDVEAQLTHGDLSLQDLHGSVTANLQAGELSGVGLGCSANLSTRAGAIELEYAERPRLLVAQTTMGKVDLVVPAGAYDLDLGSHAGVVHLFDVTHDADADSHISAFAETGEVTITGWEPSLN